MNTNNTEPRELHGARAVVEALDGCVLRAAEIQRPEVHLIETYRILCNCIKQRTGTSSGLSKLSEYLFLQYIIRSIERGCNEKFQSVARTRHTVRHESRSYIITNDVAISDLVPETRRKLDIAIFRRRNADFVRLLAAFEINASLASAKDARSLLDRLESVAHTGAYMFPVIFGNRFPDVFHEFCRLQRGRAYVISEVDYGCALNLDEAIRLVVS